MPKLMLFAPCERVIISQGDNTASLIVVIQELRFEGVIPAKEIPKNTGAIARFSIFSQWHKCPEDEGKTFEQLVKLEGAGEKVMEGVAEFKMAERIQRLVASIIVMPVLKPGEYKMTLHIREKGDSVWPEPIADYPLSIVHAVQFQPQA